MASNGIKDRVAIVGMGCTQFGEHWDKGPDDLLDRRRLRGLRVGRHRPERRRRLLARHHGRGSRGSTLSEPLKIHYKPVTHVENYLRDRQRGDPQRVLRGRVSGAYDLVMAIGVEKLKDSGYSGLVGCRARRTTARSAT